MKECGYAHVGLIPLECSKLPAGNCLVLNNDNLAEGYVNQVRKAFESMKDESLRVFISEYSPGGYFDQICKASGEIYGMLVGEMIRRGMVASERTVR